MAQETPSRDLDKIIVRLPDGMRDRLKVAADESKRSVNAEVVARLESTFPRVAYEPNLPERLGETSDDIIRRHVAAYEAASAALRDRFLDEMKADLDERHRRMIEDE